VDSLERVIFEDPEFTVSVEESFPCWEWFIYRGDEEIQNGVSLTEKSACEAGMKILAYLQGRHPNESGPPVSERSNDL
jgi:soluble methane monooxygenase-binding protein MmoD